MSGSHTPIGQDTSLRRRRLSVLVRCLVAAALSIAAFASLPDGAESASNARLVPQRSSAPISQDVELERAMPVMPGDLPAASVGRETPAGGGISAVGEHPPTFQESAWDDEAKVAIDAAGSAELTRDQACGRWLPLIEQHRGWEPADVMRFMWRESRCAPFVVSPTNDWGLLQLNATCWAGDELGGLPVTEDLPSGMRPAVLRCDGSGPAEPLTTQWCFRAKQTLHSTGLRPDSPCDAWLDPGKNIEVAYRLWQRLGWAPWCFSAESHASFACRSARNS